MITIVLDDDDEDVRNAGKPGVSPVLRKTDVATVCEQECVDFYSPGQFGGEICASTKGGRGSCSVSFFLSRSLSLSLSLSLANDFGVSLISSDFSIFSAFEAIELLSDRENATPPHHHRHHHHHQKEKNKKEEDDDFPLGRVRETGRSTATACCWRSPRSR